MVLHQNQDRPTEPGASPDTLGALLSQEKSMFLVSVCKTANILYILFKSGLFDAKDRQTLYIADVFEDYIFRSLSENVLIFVRGSSRSEAGEERGGKREGHSLCP